MGPRRIGPVPVFGAVVVALVACSSPGTAVPTGTAPTGTGPTGTLTSRVSGAPGTSSVSDSPTPAPGAPAIGDPLFPGLGNGGYDVGHYDLALRYASADVRDPLTGTVTIRATATQDLSRFQLDFAGGPVGAVTVDGTAATLARDGDELVITPARPLPRGAPFTVTVADFRTKPPSDGLGVVGTTDGTVWVGQPDGAHRIFPSNDHPSDKATFSFRLDVPTGLTAVANGRATGSSTAGGRTVWRYEETEPMTTELAQVACGRFTVVSRGTVDGVTVRDVVPTRLTARLAPTLALELRQLDWMRSKVGPYPFGVYGSLVADTTLGFAGLESQTLTLYELGDLTGPHLAAPALMAHELAHSWFGDSVSPARWSDVWLNEGHATWYQLLWEAEHPSDGTAPTSDLTTVMRGIYQQGNELRQSFGPVADPRGNDLGELFNPNVYQGGALVLFALRQQIGATAFDRLERTWATRYRDRSVTSEDFTALASEVSGRDLTGFLGAWLHGTTAPPMPGHPDWSAA